MTKKDFTLIADAINDAILQTLTTGSFFRRQLDALDPHIARTVETQMRSALATAFVSRLPYTSDGFNAEMFRNQIVTLRVVRE